MKRLMLHFCPVSTGGIALNAHHQANALAESGDRVVMLCPPDWLHAVDTTLYEQQRILVSAPHHGQYSRFRSRLLTASAIMRNAGILDRAVGRLNAKYVLLSTYSEYLAPLWAFRFRRWRRRGVWFGANLMDPVRNYVVGPRWWHDLSVQSGYSYLDDVFVHHEVDRTLTGGAEVPATVVPHGQYPMPEPTEDRAELRRQFGIPSAAVVVLCYGHLRDNKNLRKSIDALTEGGDIILIVAGSQAAPGQTQADAYQDYAIQRGVNERIHWRIGYQSDQETADLFSAADVLLLPYDRSFVSASGMLYIAAQFRTPLVFSCGDGPLSHLTAKYGLGLRISQPDPRLIADAVRNVAEATRAARWSEFVQENSYTANVSRIRLRMDRFDSGRTAGVPEVRVTEGRQN